MWLAKPAASQLGLTLGPLLLQCSRALSTAACSCLWPHCSARLGQWQRHRACGAALQASRLSTCTLSMAKCPLRAPSALFFFYTFPRSPLLYHPKFRVPSHVRPALQISKALLGEDQRLRLPRFLEEEQDPGGWFCFEMFVCSFPGARR